MRWPNGEKLTNEMASQSPRLRLVTGRSQPQGRKPLQTGGNKQGPLSGTEQCLADSEKERPACNRASLGDASIAHGFIPYWNFDI